MVSAENFERSSARDYTLSSGPVAVLNSFNIILIVAYTVTPEEGGQWVDVLRVNVCGTKITNINEKRRNVHAVLHPSTHYVL